MLHDSLSDWFKPIIVRFSVFCQNPAAIYEDVLRRRRPVQVQMSDGRSFFIFDGSLADWLRTVEFSAIDAGFPEPVASKLAKAHTIGVGPHRFREVFNWGRSVTTSELASSRALEHLSVSKQKYGIETMFPIDDERYYLGSLPLLFASECEIFDAALRFVCDCFRARNDADSPSILFLSDHRPGTSPTY